MTTPLTDAVMTDPDRDGEDLPSLSRQLERKLTRLTLIAECLAADLRRVRPKAESIQAYDRIKP